MSARRESTAIEEQANTWTHALGILLASIGIPLLFLKIPVKGNWQLIFGIGAFAFGLFAVYISSTIYHALAQGQRKKVMQLVDHISIFFLIGGTYTAFILTFYNEPFGQLFLGLHWLIIAFGVLFKLYFKTRYDYISLGLYLLLGWMVIGIYEPITAGMSTLTWIFLLLGGLMYSLGTVFYVWRRIRFHHAIWHVFVLAGSTAHFLGLYFAF